MDSTTGVNLTNIVVTEVTKGEAAMTHFTLLSGDAPAPSLPVGARESDVGVNYKVLIKFLVRKGPFRMWVTILGAISGFHGHLPKIRDYISKSNIGLWRR